MNEIREIVRAVKESDEQLALATVVDVVGSSYRRPAARMLIFPDGKHIGSISGGCLERDLCQAALDITKAGAKLISFDTRRDSTNFNPRYNLGCNGIIYVLVERITRDEFCPTASLQKVETTRRAQVTGTVYQSEVEEIYVGKRFRSPADLELRDSEELADIWAQVAEDSRPTCCEIVTSSGSVRALIEKTSPPKPLWIFGAGDDARPLVAMAEQLGWEITVIDHQTSKLTARRFPNAQRFCVPWHEALSKLGSTEDTAAVLMTHSFDADKMLLPQLLETNVSYIGVLGPKSRTGRVLRELLRASGSHSLARRAGILHTPVGLDVGATNPAEIAVSILAEIIALENEREGGLLGEREGPIHEPGRHVLIDFTRDLVRD